MSLVHTSFIGFPPFSEIDIPFIKTKSMTGGIHCSHRPFQHYTVESDHSPIHLHQCIGINRVIVILSGFIVGDCTARTSYRSHQAYSVLIAENSYTDDVTHLVLLDHPPRTQILKDYSTVIQCSPQRLIPSSKALNIRL